jgi:predicted class III extradiol MEMO1 family dioxygenase
MPDFDKNLKPIIVETPSVDLKPNLKGIPGYNIPYSSTPDLSQPESAIDRLNKLSQNTNPNSTRPFVTNEQLEANQRFSTYNPTLDQEDAASYGQADWKKAVNGLLKGTNLAATTVAGGFAMLGGAIGSIFTQKLSTIWDNPATQMLDKLNEKLDNEYLPNYYTNVEKDADWWSSDNWFKTNFLFDKLIKNSGFAVGAMYSGNLANSGFLKLGQVLGKASIEAATLLESTEAFKKFSPLLKNTARVFSLGENLKAAEVLTKGISNIGEIESVSTELANIAKSANSINKFSETARRTLVSAYSSAGESGFEALQTGNEYRKKLIEDYKKDHNGEEPVGQDLEEIEKLTRKVGLTSFVGNLAILSATEYFQLPKLLGSNYSASRASANSLLGNARDVVSKDGIWEAVTSKTLFGKLYDRSLGVGRYVFDPKEALQENLQYALQIGTQNYFNKAYRTDYGNRLIDSVVYGFLGKDEKGKPVGSLVSKEGIEGAILGGITGAGMQAISNYSESKATDAATKSFISELNNAPTFQKVVQDKINSINRSIMLEQDKQSSIIQDDKLEFDDLMADDLHNYLSTRIKYGRFDMVMDDLEDLKQQASTPEGLANLKSQGIGNIDDTVSSFSEKIENIKTVANSVNELYKYTNIQYGSKLNDKGERIYSNQLIDKMVYAAHKITDYDVRIPLANRILVENGISTRDIVEGIIEKGIPNKDATDEVLKQIDDITKNSIVTKKDELKTALSDVIELNLRRRLYLDEYNDMAENPEDYELPTESAEQQKVNVSQNVEYYTKSGKKKIKTDTVDLDVGKRYNLNDPLFIDDDGSIIDLPNLKVLSKTLGGEYEVELPNGDITFIPSSDFIKYNLAGDADTDLLKESLNEAIELISKKAKYKNLGIQNKSDKLEYIKSLKNKELANDLKKLAKDIYSKKLEEIKKLESLKNELANQANALELSQSSATIKSGEVFTPEYDPNLDFENSAKKDVIQLFNSTTLPSEKSVGVLDNWVINHEIFVNRLDSFVDKELYKIILVPGSQESVFGLSGITDLAWKPVAGTDPNNDPRKINPDNGIILAVFVKNVNGEYYYVNSDGKVLSKVGENVSDVSSIIFSTMPSTSTTWPSDGSNRYRYPKGLPDESKPIVDGLVKELAEKWRLVRSEIINNPVDLKKLEIYDFNLSKGFPIKDPNQVLKNSVQSIMNLDNDIIENTENLIQVSTTGKISHNSIDYNIPEGRVVIKYGSQILYLQNRKLNKNETEVIYEIIKNLKDQLVSKKSIDFNTDDYFYLRNVLFWKNSNGNFSKNQIYIDFKKLTFRIGSAEFNLLNFENEKASFMQTLENNVYMSINNKTLSDLSNKFAEPYLDSSNTIQYRIWNNYQSYLLSKVNPDNSNREIPLTLNIAEPSSAKPYSFEQKYATLPALLAKINKPSDTDTEVEISTEETETVPNLINLDLGQSEHSPTVNPIVINLSDTGDVSTESTEDFDIPIDINNIISTDSINPVVFNSESVSSVEESEDSPPVNPQTINIDFSSESVIDLSNINTPNVDNDIINPKDDLGFVDPFSTEEYRKKSIKIESSRMTEDDEKVFVDWVSKKLPNLKYSYLENMIKVYGTNKEAWGRFVNGAIEIVRGGLRGTEYHEVWEYIENGFLTQSQIKELNDEFRSRKGTFIDRETGISYSYNDPRVTDSMIKERRADDFADYRLGKIPAKNLSERIRNFFKSIIDYVKSFFKKKSLQEELFEKVENGEFANLTLSVDRISGIPEYRIAEELPLEREFELIQYIKAMFFRGMFSTNSSLFDTKRNAKEIFDIIKNTLIGQGYSEETINKLIKETKQSLSSEKIEFNDDEDVTINQDDVNNRNYAPDAFTVDFKKSSPFAIKLLSSSLIRLTYDESGKAVPVPSKVLKTFQLIPYNEVYAVLSKTLTNTISVDDAITKLYNLAKRDASYRTLFTRLGGNLSTGKIDFNGYDSVDKYRLFTQFMDVYTKQSPELIIQNSNEFGTFVGVASFSKASQQVESEWLGNIVKLAKEKNNNIVKYENKEFKINSSELDKVKGNSSDETKLNFLNSIGIPFTKKDLNNLKEINAKDEFNQYVNGLILDLKNGDALLKYIVKGNNFKSQVGSNLSKLAELYSKVNSVNFNSTTSNAEGKNQQIYTDSNFYSNLVYHINNSSNLKELYDKLPQLRDVFSKNSVILKSFYTEKGLRKGNAVLSLKVMNGIFNEETDKGKSISKLNFNDRQIVEINQNLNGNYYILVPADSSTEWMLSLGNNIDYKSVERFVSGKNSDVVLNIYKNYLFDEIKLALDFKNREIYKNVKSKAKELRFFKQLLSLTSDGIKSLNDINDFIKKVSEGELSFEENELDSVITKLISDNSSSIDSSLKVYITQMSSDLLNNLQTSGVITSSGNSYSFSQLDKNALSNSGIKLNVDKLTETELLNLFNYLNLNYVTNNIEIHKIIFGDPYQFKISEKKGKVILDETKRTKSFGSPAKFLINFPQFNEFFNKVRNTVSYLEENLVIKNTDIGYHTYKGYISTAVIDDIEILGKFYNDPKKYPMTNEADAQSWMSPGLYREVKDRMGQWNDEYESFYQWQMAYARKKLSEKGKYKYSNNILKNHDNLLLKKPCPDVKIEILKPIASGTIYNSDNLTTLLDKMSQFPIFYQAVEDTNLENIFIKMFKENIDYIVPTSARKEGVTTPYKLYINGKLNTENFSKSNKLNIPWETYRIQLDTTYVDKKGTTMGSQLPKIITSNLYDSGKPVSENAEKLVYNHDKSLEALYQDGYENFLEELGIVDKGNSFEIVDKTTVAKTLRKEFLKRGMSKNALASLDLNPDTKNFEVPFEASNNYVYIRRLLYSMLDKRITSQKLNGISSAQVASTMWEKLDSSRSLAIKTKDGYKEITKNEFDKLSDEEKSNVVITSSDLKFYENEDGKRYCEILIPLTSELKHVFSDKSKFPDEASILNYLNNNLEEALFGVGFRIPTQALNSIERFKIKGFLPAFMGKSVVVPSEITTKAGSDFDIDKLNMYIKSIFIDADDKVKLYTIDKTKTKSENLENYRKIFDELFKKKSIKQLLNASLEESEEILNKISDIESGQIKDETLIEMREKFAKNAYSKALQNEYYKSLEDILDSPESFDKLVSINNTDTLIEVSDNILNITNDNESNISNRLLNRNYMSKLRHMFLTGKAWVGIVAVHITGHSNTQKAGTYVADNKYKLTLPHNSITINDESYVSVSGIYDSNKKYITENLSEFINAIVDIAKDPYIVNIIYSPQLVDLMMFFMRAGVSIENASYFLQQPIVKESVIMADNKGSNILSFLTNKVNYDNIIQMFPTNDSVTDTYNYETLIDNILDYNNSKLTSVQNKEQILILDEFINSLKAANGLSEINQSTSYDTAYIRSSEQLNRLNLKTSNQINSTDPTVIKMSNVTSVLKSTYLNKLRDLLSSSNEALGELLKFNKTDFRNIINSILSKYQSNKYISNDDKELIENMVVGSLLDFIIQKNKSYSISNLFYGDNSVFNLLKTAKANNPGSPLLNLLDVSYVKGLNETPVIKTKTMLSNDSYQEDYYVNLMRSFKFENPELYNALVKYSILQGTNQTRYSLKSLIPFEDYSAMVADIINSEISANDDTYSIFKNNFLFLRNNYNNDKLVPKVKLNSQEVNVTYQGTIDVEEIREYVFNQINYLDDSNDIKNSYLKISKYSNYSKYDILAIPRLLKANSEFIDTFERKTITESSFAKEYRSGKNQYNKVIGFQLVMFNGKPYTVDNSYVYKPINLYGDGKSIVEYPLNGNSSEIVSSVEKVNEMSDYDFINSVIKRINEQNEKNKKFVKDLQKQIESKRPPIKTLYGNDIDMRKIATGAIVEFKSDKVESSSFTTLTDVGEDNSYSYEKDRYVGQSYNGLKNNKNYYGSVVMLARDGKLSGTNLSEDTKSEIKTAHNQGTEFIVGDMPNVDTQFIDYLQEIGAKFTMYHTGQYPFERNGIRNLELEKKYGFDDKSQINIQNVNKSIQPSIEIEGTVDNNPAEYTNHSGGAKLSDTQWDQIGRKFGVINHKHYREPLEYIDTYGNLSKGSEELDSLTLRSLGIKPTHIEQKDYNEGSQKATAAFRMMYTDSKEKSVRSNYIIRNWMQVKNADAIYAIGTIKQPGENASDKINETRIAAIPIVKGGTGYAVQMAINEGKPVYVFDGTKEGWYVYDYNIKNFVPTKTPTLTKNFAGIGSRTLSTQEVVDKSIQAIIDVYENTFKKDVNRNENTQIPLTQSQINFAKQNKVEQNFYDKKPYPKEIDARGNVTKWEVYKSKNGKSSMKAALDGDRTETTRSVSQIEQLKSLAKNQGIVNGITGTIIWMEGQVDNVKDSNNIEGDWFKITSEPYTPNKVDFNKYENWDSSVWDNRNIEFNIGLVNEWKSVRFERIAKPTQVSTVQQENENTITDEIENNLFKTKIDQYQYSYNPDTNTVIHNSKTGDKIETNPTQIGKVLANYAKFQSLETKEFNNHYYSKVGNYVINIDNGNIVKDPNILKLFEEKDITDVPFETTDIIDDSKNEIGEVEQTQEKFTYKGKSIDIRFKLSNDQEYALKKLIDFIEDPNRNVITLQGAAGTGKTSIIGYVNRYREAASKYQGIQKALYLAPTHAATLELGFGILKTLTLNPNYKRRLALPMTVTSAIATKITPKGTEYKLSKKANAAIGFSNLIVVDETSMLKNSDYDKLIEISKKGYKIIFIGDKQQIPEVSKGFNNKKQISKAFTNHEIINLDTIHRVSNEDIKKVLQKTRDSKVFQMYKTKDTEHLKFFKSDVLFKQKFIKVSESSPYDTLYIGYTNRSVSAANKMIREELFGRTGLVQKDDVIMGYLGYGSKQIGDDDKSGNLANSVSYLVKSVERKTIKLELQGTEHVLYELDLYSEKLKKLSDSGFSVRYNIIAYYAPLSNNESIYNTLSNEDYEKNNKSFSKIFKKLHIALKEAVNENTIYGWQVFEGERDYVSRYMEFIDVGADYIYDYKKNRFEPYNEEDVYLNENIQDLVKYYGKNLEKFVIKKGIDYGHAVTIHKSQGMTIENTFFDASTITKNDIDIMEGNQQISTERQSLSYVGLSRASKNLYVLEGNFNYKDVEDTSPEETPTSKNLDLIIDLSTRSVSKDGTKEVQSNIENLKKQISDLKVMRLEAMKRQDIGLQLTLLGQIGNLENELGNILKNNC